MGIQSDLGVWAGDTKTWESDSVSAGRSHLTSRRAQGNGTPPTASPTQKSQKVAPEVAQNLNLETELLKQENVFLRRRIEELEVDRADWKTERSKLQSIIERQLALPSPERRGWVARLVDWARN